MLMLHKGCRRVVRADLADIPVPEASGRHLPVPHHVLADTVVATAEDLGLPLRSESWGLSDDGMRLYGALDFDPIAKLRMPEGTGAWRMSSEGPSFNGIQQGWTGYAG